MKRLNDSESGTNTDIPTRLTLSDLINPDKAANKMKPQGRLLTDSDKFLWAFNRVFEDLPEIADAKKLKNAIIKHFKKCELPEIFEVKGQMAETKLDLAAILPFAFYWLYRQALRIPRTESEEIHGLNALEIALNCFATYLPQLLKRTELNLKRAQTEALLEAFNAEDAFRRIPQKWRKQIEREYQISLKRGHPLTREPLARKALEMKTANPKLSWMRIAQKLCDCGNREHDYRCKENIRQGVTALKKKL